MTLPSKSATSEHYYMAFELICMQCDCRHRPGSTGRRLHPPAMAPERPFPIYAPDPILLLKTEATS